MAKRYYLGIDQGTTGTTVLLLDEYFCLKGRGYREHRQYYPKPGRVEHNPTEIWQALLFAVRQALDSAGARPEEICCIGLDNQGETCLIWDRATGEPVAPAIVWQDRRTAQDADRLSCAFGELIRARTGLVVDAYFSATKLRWLLDNIPGLQQRAQRGEVLGGTLDSWLLWKLTGRAVHATDPSTASRTMLYSLETGDWDSEILEMMGIPRKLLPEIRDSAGFFGITCPEEFFGVSIPITAALTDQQAALFGQDCFSPGDIKTTYGTGCFMLMNTGSRAVRSESGLLTTVAWKIGKELTYALDGGIYIAGAAVQWLRDGLKLIESAGETTTLALNAPDNGGMYFVPAFAGLAAPHWDQYARGTIVGLTAGVTREQFVRATLESVAYQVSDILEVMQKDAGRKISAIRADGGMVGNQFLMQFQADILGIPVEVSEIADITAFGVARCAALGLGSFSTPDELLGQSLPKKHYIPNMTSDQRQYLMHQWHRAVERSLAWEEDELRYRKGD